MDTLNVNARYNTYLHSFDSFPSVFKYETNFWLNKIRSIKLIITF